MTDRLNILSPVRYDHSNIVKGPYMSTTTDMTRMNYAPAGITSKDSNNFIHQSDLQCQLYRVFNNACFHHGGRFYGAQYHRLNSKERGAIIINGNPIVEIDYSSLHPRMLYHINNLDYLSDPYKI